MVRLRRFGLTGMSRPRGSYASSSKLGVRSGKARLYHHRVHDVHLQVAHDVERHSHVDAAELGVSSSIDQFFYRSVRHEWRMYEQCRNDIEDRVQSDQELV